MQGSVWDSLSGTCFADGQAPKSSCTVNARTRIVSTYHQRRIDNIMAPLEFGATPRDVAAAVHEDAHLSFEHEESTCKMFALHKIR